MCGGCTARPDVCVCGLVRGAWRHRGSSEHPGPSRDAAWCASSAIGPGAGLGTPWLFSIMNRSCHFLRRQSWWQWLRGWWNIGTIGGFSRLYDTISKIRARHGTRLRAAQTAGAADSHESQRRGREVFRRKVGHTPRHYPVRGKGRGRITFTYGNCYTTSSLP